MRRAGKADLAGVPCSGVFKDLGILGSAGVVGRLRAFHVEIELEGFYGVVFAYFVAFKQGG